MHFGNGDESDSAVIRKFLSAHLPEPAFDLYVFPGLPYGALRVETGACANLEKALDPEHRCVQLRFGENERWVFFVPSAIAPEKFSKAEALLKIPESISTPPAGDIYAFRDVLVPGIAGIEEPRRITGDSDEARDESRRGLAEGGLPADAILRERAHRVIRICEAHWDSATDFPRRVCRYRPPKHTIIVAMRKKMAEVPEFDVVTVVEVSPGQGVPVDREPHIFEDVSNLPHKEIVHLLPSIEREDIAGLRGRDGEASVALCGSELLRRGHWLLKANVEDGSRGEKVRPGGREAPVPQVQVRRLAI